MSHILSLRWNSLQLFNISTKTFFHDISRKGYILFGQSDEFSTKTFFTISYLDKVMNFLNLLCWWGRRANTKSFVLNLKENVIFTLWERNSHDHILSWFFFSHLILDSLEVSVFWEIYWRRTEEMDVEHIKYRSLWLDSLKLEAALWSKVSEEYMLNLR